MLGIELGGFMHARQVLYPKATELFQPAINGKLCGLEIYFLKRLEFIYFPTPILQAFS